MTTQHRASVITAPPLAGGFACGFAAYLIGYSIEPGQAMIGAGIGIILGFFITFPLWLLVYERWTVPPARGREVQPVSVKPVEIHWRDTDNVISRQTLKSVNSAELCEVAAKVIHKGHNITFRGLTSILPDKTITNLQNELVAKRLADWRSYDQRTNQPNRNRGIRLTEKGHRLMVEAIRQSPPPPRRVV